MSLILNIDTALETASISLALEGRIIEQAINDKQKDHAAWLHPAVNELIQKTKYRLPQLDAVAVSNGPGSYTGLRVGLSAAKGYCFALGIPLITVGTLEILADSVLEKATDLICPMIDARRMEVFTAVYDKNMTEQVAPHALILDADSFSQLLDAHSILFCGNGSKKLQNIIQNPHAVFTADSSSTVSLARLSQKHLLENKFADLAYCEPLYIKEFYSPVRKN